MSLRARVNVPSLTSAPRSIFVIPRKRGPQGPQARWLSPGSPLSRDDEDEGMAKLKIINQSFATRVWLRTPHTSSIWA
jgi:hypothetical protein